MDRSKWIAKLQASSKKLFLWGGIALAGVIGLTVVLKSGPQAVSKLAHAGSAVVEYLSIRELVEIYGQAFISVQKKVDALRHAEEVARTLAMENAKLRLERETSEFECVSRIAESNTKKFEFKLVEKTGTPVGRIPESITYRAPDLAPNQLLTLGRSYFRDRDDEKAAVVLTTVTGLDGARYQSAEIHLMAGIAWYRLDHLELSNWHLDRVLAKGELPENLRYQAQARLWKALGAAKGGKKMKAQYWLRELVDYHPHSREASWVNSAQSGSERVTRVPASKK